MAKQAIVKFVPGQWGEEDLDEPIDEQPIEFSGEFRGYRNGRIHVRIVPDLDRAFLDKKAVVVIPHSFNKEYRGVYVGDDNEGNAVFDRVNVVGGGSRSV